MYESILLFVSLVLGYYLFNFKPTQKNLKRVNTCLDFIVILIIFSLGYNFSIFTHTNKVVIQVITISISYTVAILTTNLLGLFIYCSYNKKVKIDLVSKSEFEKKDNNTILSFLKSGKYSIYLIAGYALGQFINIDITNFIDKSIFVVLIILMLIIGILLKLEDIPFRNLFKDKTALIIVAIVAFSSIISAVFICFVTNIPLKESVMVSSGLGWYSLSAILNTDFIGQYYGMVTFMIDFLREVLVIIMIPLFKKVLSVELVGYAANTAMDFCLPVIKDSYGTKIMSLAIAVGLGSTMATPVLLILENMFL